MSLSEHEIWFCWFVHREWPRLLPVTFLSRKERYKFTRCRALLDREKTDDDNGRDGRAPRGCVRISRGQGHLLARPPGSRPRGSRLQTRPGLLRDAARSPPTLHWCGRGRPALPGPRVRRPVPDTPSSGKCLAGQEETPRTEGAAASGRGWGWEGGTGKADGQDSEEAAGTATASAGQPELPGSWRRAMASRGRPGGSAEPRGAGRC